jgi:RND family efflux transporter MFP subunit
MTETPAATPKRRFLLPAAIGLSLVAGLLLGVFVAGRGGSPAGDRANGGPSAGRLANGPTQGQDGAPRAGGQNRGQPGGMGGPGGQAGMAGPPGGRGGDFRMQRPPAVTLVRPNRAPIAGEVTAIGTGRAVQSLTLTAEVSGLVEELKVKPGERVAAGAPLIVLERRQQEIALARARADFAIARTNAARFEGLRESEAASAVEDEAARNAMTAATAALRQAEYDLDRRTIRAPFAGVVGLTMLSVGDFLSVGAPLTTIDDISSLLVDFVIPETLSPYVKEGIALAAIAQANDGVRVAGVVRAVDSRVDPASRTRRVEAVLPNESGQLIPGSTFRISLNLEGRTGMTTPGLAVQWDRAGSFVWRVGADGAAERVGVTILRREGDTVLVEGQLAEGDEIVAEGADLVRAGAPLRRPANGTGGAASAQ